VAECQCEGIESRFDAAYAAQKLDRYRRTGPDPTTGALLDALRAEGVEGLTLLDIGGGVGAIQHELLRAGVSSVVEVEASAAYQDACRAEAERQGHADRIEHHLGDFGSLADAIAPADIVTLDRSVCCWPDMPGLVRSSAVRARRLYGLVYPRDDWWVRVGWRAFSRLRMLLHSNPMQVYVHRTRDVEGILRGQGLVRRSHRTMGVWQVAVFARL
jgi:magnesium-protoporphyrin O-methyltransferase